MSVSPARSVPFSARISTEDAAFIAGLEIDGAHTPSDKLRALLADARKRQLGSGDYDSSLQMAMDWLQPLRRHLQSAEHRHQTHSALLARLIEWLPDTLAFLQVAADNRADADTTELRRLEQGATDRIARLMEALLQLALVNSSCYDPEQLRQRLKPSLELAAVLNHKSPPTQENIV